MTSITSGAPERLGAEAPAESAHRRRAFEHAPVNPAGIFDQDGRLAPVASGDLDQPDRLERIGRADDQHQVGLGAIFLIAC